jgi:hypothetical protein
MQDMLNSEDVSAAQIQKENKEFEEYAGKLIQQWESEGKDIGLLSKSLHKESAGSTKKTAAPDGGLDHFSRLGFIARWLPPINQSE